METKKQARGYSLVELLVVLGILGLLSSLAMPLAEMTVQRQKERELKRALWEIRDAIDEYRRARERGDLLLPPGLGAGSSVYPPSLDALLAAGPDARPEHRGETLRFLRRVPRDPFAPSELPAAKTWGLRSYLSEPDRPRAGPDVYDVYSTSDRTGLNGVPLKDW